MKNKKTPGQVAVIITIFIAVIILLSVVLINIGKVADIKTTTAQIADSGVLNLASQWSMYCNALRDTLKRKADASTLLGSGLGCVVDSDVRIACLNWSLILPLAGVLLTIILLPFSPMISAGIFLLVANPLLTEVNAIMKGGFQTAAAQMTQYAAMRESSIESMLQQAQFDKAWADRIPGTDIFRYQYGCQPQPSGPCIPLYYYYDVTGYPVAAYLEGKNRIPRYSAWYWSERHPKVSEVELVPLVDNFIKNDLLAITELNTWHVPTWMYTEVSLKVDAPNITCAAVGCPEWAVPEKGIVRILSHVTVQEQDVIATIWNWLASLLGWDCTTAQLGFLPVKFMDLTKRLHNTVQYHDYVTWNSCEIVTVTEALRGLMLRIMELINIPVSHRIPSLNDWLPVWYNYNNPSDPDTIYRRLRDILEGSGTMVGLNEWLDRLHEIEDDVSAIVPEPNGDCANGWGDPVGWCWLISCCDPCEYQCCCSCSCCGATDYCTWQGIYCTCNPEINNQGLCGHGDIYETRTPPCPLTPLYISPCQCAGCYDCCEPPSLHAREACRFQGELNWRNHSGPTEIAQAIELLTNLQTEINDLMDAIRNFANEAHDIMYPDAAKAQLQKEAIYGWRDSGEDVSTLNIVRVNLNDYPSREVFPYIKEHYEWFGIWKVWTIEGTVDGPIGEVTIQRYTSDISAGPWWNLRYRRNPADPEWPTGALGGYIHSIQDTGISGVGEADFNTYAITSATKGTYGMGKDRIRIERVR